MMHNCLDLHSPGLVAGVLSVGYGTWPPIAGITLLPLFDLNTVWERLSRNGLWVHVTGGNFHHFSKATDSPLAQPEQQTHACI